MEARLKTHHKLMIAALVAFTAALLLVAGVYAYDKAQEDQIAPGVSIGGVDVGGRSADEARALIEDEIVAPLQKPVEVTYEGETYRLSSTRLDQTADVDGMVDEAVAVSRDGNLVDRVSRYVQGSEVDVDLDPQVSYSEDAVDAFVGEVATEVNQEPVDASIEPTTEELVPTQGQPGVSLRENQLTKLVTRQVESPGVEKEIDATVRRVAPEVTTKELASAYPTYITVDQGSYTLRLFENLKLVKSYGVAVGGGGYSTPTGLHSIQDKQVDPTWNVPTSSWAGSLAGQSIPPGPSNPLKARWMGIYDGAGIHGTDDVGSIGSAASHGCVRMTIDDVTDLFDRVDVGTPIYIQ